MRISSLFILAYIIALTFQIELRKRVIVIVDSSTYQVTHSVFFQDLEKKGFDLEFGSLNSISLKLEEFDEYLYDHMIIMATTEITGKGLTLKKVLDFYDAGNNVFVAGNIDASKFQRQLYNALGVDIDPLGTQVWDDYNTPSFTVNHAIVQTANQEADAMSFGPQTQNPILYQGVALKVSSKQNFQRWGILKGENTTYSFNSADNTMVQVGSENVFVAAIQGRNQARAILTGSIEMLSNNFYKRKEFSNREYVNNLILWNFGINGILKAENIHHHKEHETEIPFSYKIEEQIYYYINIYRWNYTISEWVPYITNDHQIMLEFTMLDPYYRVPLIKKIGEAQYSATFQAPDKHGVYQFKINYHRPGYTFLDLSTKVPVRPPKHNEFKRYLQQAYPYYTASFASLLGLFVFIYFLLFDKDEGNIKKNVQSNKQKLKKE